MTQEEKNEKLENFNFWIQTIEERILDWKQTLNQETKNQFDYSVQSLDKIESYLTSKYELEDLSNQQNKIEIDACLSYVLEVFRRNLPTNEFLIELEDEKNVLFNRPAVNTKPKVGMDFSPYYFLPSIINLKRVGDFRKQFEIKMRKYSEEYSNEK